MKCFTKNRLSLYVVLLIVLGIASPSSAAQNACFATGDIDADGSPLSVGDLTTLVVYLSQCGSAPDTLFSADLNGDCVVDTNDALVFQNFLVLGFSAFDPYGGYPVPTCCDPAVELIPDTARIFGMINVSPGTACYDTSGGVLTVHSVLKKKDTTKPTTKSVDAEADGKDGDWSRVEIIMDNFDSDGSLQVGGSMAAEIGFSINGQPNTFALKLSQTKTATNTWDLAVQSGSATYTVQAYLHDTLVFNVDSISVDSLGYIFETARGVYPAGFKGSSTGKPAGVVAWPAPDGVQWTWAAQSVAALSIDQLSVMAKDVDSTANEIEYISLYPDSISAFTIISESYTYNYRGLSVTNLGNASMQVVGTSLVVGMIGSGGQDGCHAEAQDKDGEWSIVVANPDQGGGLPVGARLEVEFVFAHDTTGTITDTMVLSQTKAPANTMGLAVQSGSVAYTVEAYRNNVLVFNVDSVLVDSLGYIVETARGVYPCCFKGSSTGKPAGVVVWPAPDGVLWTWNDHAVASLQIDSLRVTAEDSDPTVVGIASATLRASDMPSFTILDIQISTSCCAGTRGDVNGDGADLDIVDLTATVDYLFGVQPPIPCVEEADVNGDGQGPTGPDIVDLTFIVDWLFSVAPTLVACP